MEQQKIDKGTLAAVKGLSKALAIAAGAIDDQRNELHSLEFEIKGSARLKKSDDYEQMKYPAIPLIEMLWLLRKKYKWSNDYLEKLMQEAYTLKYDIAPFKDDLTIIQKNISEMTIKVISGPITFASVEVNDINVTCINCDE